MNTFSGNDGRARTVAELRAYALKAHDAVLINGYDRSLRCPGAAFVDGHEQALASFMEFHPRTAYYLREDSPGEIAWESEVIPADAQGDVVVAVFSMAVGMGSALPQPAGYFTLEIEGIGVIPFCIRSHSQLWEQGDTALYFDARRVARCAPGQALVLDSYLQQEHMAAFGIGLLCLPLMDEIRGKRLRLSVRGHAATATTRFFKLDLARDMLTLVNLYAPLDAVCKGRICPKAGEYTVYFGDIHTHSGQDNIVENTGCGYGTIDENYWYARNVSMLDVYALTDHDWGIIPSGAWPRQVEAADTHYHPGTFCTIPAFEWTSEAYGHRNVYFADTHGTQAFSRDTPDGPMTPEALWAALDACGVPYMTVPHHPSAVSHPFTFEHYNADRDRLIEIYSCWGNSEHAGCTPKGDGADRYEDNYVVDGLARGWQVGFVASSDGHDGHPGNAQTPGFFHGHLAHYLGSGWVGILAKELTREAIFEALYNRRCYGTTGVPIVLNVLVNGHPMGSILQVEEKQVDMEIEVQVSGTARIDCVEIISANQVLHIEQGNTRTDGRDLHFTWTGTLPRGGYCYAKVTQSDGEMAWSSPIYLT